MHRRQENRHGATRNGKQNVWPKPNAEEKGTERKKPRKTEGEWEVTAKGFKTRRRTAILFAFCLAFSSISLLSRSVCQLCFFLTSVLLASSFSRYTLALHSPRLAGHCPSSWISSRASLFLRFRRGLGLCASRLSAD
ncbi:putative transmembrane protein [Toxoplasma gondii RUB]|uniref:Putative transmembrane protein n=1 Tax=Toxoplasma gondii RUB TaxID=935652 RepID=A0A086LYZ6_TOXGO|nr:putative transmembrane protein [Toxoplasma gondii RUB]